MRQNKKQKDLDLLQLGRLLTGRMWCIIPKTISLLGETWTIEIDNNLAENINGTCNYQNKIITIREHKHSFRTLIHEINHARSKLFGSKWTETEIRLNTLFDMQVYEQLLLSPIARLWASMDNDLEIVKECEKEKLIIQLQEEIKLKNKQIKKLTAQNDTRQKKKGNLHIKPTAQKLKTKLKEYKK